MTLKYVGGKIQIKVSLFFDLTNCIPHHWLIACSIMTENDYFWLSLALCSTFDLLHLNKIRTSNNLYLHFSFLIWIFLIYEYIKNWWQEFLFEHCKLECKICVIQCSLESILVSFFLYKTCYCNVSCCYNWANKSVINNQSISNRYVNLIKNNIWITTTKIVCYPRVS